MKLLFVFVTITEVKYLYLHLISIFDALDSNTSQIHILCEAQGSQAAIKYIVYPAKMMFACRG